MHDPFVYQFTMGDLVFFVGSVAFFTVISTIAIVLSFHYCYKTKVQNNNRVFVCDGKRSDIFALPEANRCGSDGMGLVEQEVEKKSCRIS